LFQHLLTLIITAASRLFIFFHNIVPR